MINIGIEKSVDKKAMLRRIAPMVIFASILIVSWLVFINFYFDDIYSSDVVYQTSAQEQEQIRIQGLIDFLEGESFNNLIYIPNPSIFNQVTTIDFIPGKKNPFAEN